MAKIAVFAGRVHHVERLIGVVTLLKSKGHDVNFITLDNYLNIDPNSGHLIRGNVPFVHVLNYLPQDDTARLMTAEAISQISTITNYVDPFHVSASLREACESLVAFQAFLVKEKPDLVLGLHENNFWYRILAYLCNMLSIPSVSFQEGMLRLRDETTQGKQSIAANYSTKLLCWSEASKESYMRAGVPASKLVATGISHLDPYFVPYSKQSVAYRLGLDQNRKIVAFLLPQTNRFDGNWQEQLSRVIEWTVGKSVQLVVRFHPFESEQLANNLRAGLGNNKNVKVFTGNTIDLIRASDMVITQHSTVAVEAMALGVPLVEIDLENRGVLESLAAQGVSILVQSGEISKLSDVLSGKLVVDPAKLKEWSSRNLGPTDGHATDRVVAELEKLL